MIYSIDFILNTIKDIMQKYEMTKNLIIKDIKHVSARKHYLITLSDGEERIIPRKLINTCIESLGDKGELEIAGRLVHPIDLEKDAPDGNVYTTTDDFWEQGDLRDVMDYIKKRKRLCM